MITKEELVKFLDWIVDNGWNKNIGYSDNKIIEDYLKTLTPESKDADFELFWSPIYGKKWTGSKSDAKNKFNKALKEVDATTLIIAKNDYFSYLAVCSFDRMVMGGSVFLNTTNKRWEEDWKEQASAELKKQGKSPATTASTKSIDDLFND